METKKGAGFDVDKVRKIVKESLDTTIGQSAFQQSRVRQWNSSVVEHCLSQLSKMEKPFKCIVNCVIMQKCGAGLQAACSCFWDNSTDGSCTVRWENDSVECVVIVFGMAV